MLYLSVPVASSSDRHLLTYRLSTLSLKTVHRAVFCPPLAGMVAFESLMTIPDHEIKGTHLGTLYFVVGHQGLEPRTNRL